MQVRFVDESDFGFGWIHPEPRWMQRASHALVVDGRVWLVDPTGGEGVEERIRSLGEPAGVVQLLPWHRRDCAAVGERLRVPVHAMPFAGLPDAPFEVLEVEDEVARDVYGYDLILLRPDMHVVWRGNKAPESPNQIAAVATGH